MKKLLTIIFTILIISGCMNSGLVKTYDDNYSGSYYSDDRPVVEVVFVLDATGSMYSLIEGAKRKIWSIANQIVTGDPTPEVRIGLVIYRDRGDEFVVKGYDLTDDIDEIYYNLIGVTADGGGDFPEDVNQALAFAVDSISWSEDDNTLKMIFLVGDAPPHMDYNDEKHYDEVCHQAIADDIVINTIRCGSESRTEEVWMEIAHLADGRYTTIDYSTSAEIPTPYDEELASLSSDLYGTVLIYGAEEYRYERKAMLDVGGMASGETPSVAADRATFAGSKSGFGGGITSRDLLGEMMDGTIELDDIPEDELPDVLTDLTESEREAYIDSLKIERDEITRKIAEITEKRNEYIEENTEDEEDSFDVFVIETLKEQADRIGINYGGE